MKRVRSIKVGPRRFTLHTGMRRRSDQRTWFSVSPVTLDDDSVCGVGVWGPKRGVLLEWSRRR